MRMNFKNMSEFLEKLDDDVCEILGEPDMTVSVVGDYDFITDLLNEYFIYCNEGEYRLVNCELEMPELNGYDDAFVITFCGGGEIWVTKPYNNLNHKYNIYDSTIAYVQEEFIDKWNETNDGGIVISFVDDKKVAKNISENFKLNDDEKGFTYSGNDGNSNFFIEYNSSENLPKEFIDIVKKLFN